MRSLDTRHNNTEEELHAEASIDYHVWLTLRSHHVILLLARFNTNVDTASAVHM